MKRKSVMKLLGALALISLLNGCGEESTIPNKGLDAVEENQDNQRTPTPTASQIQSEQSAPEIEPTMGLEQEPILGERLEAWDEFYQKYGNYYTAVQIEDMFFYPGMLGSELGEVIANSKDTKIEKIAMSKLMEPDQNVYNKNTQQIVIYRDEIPWFTVYVRNYKDDLVALEDCIISLVVPSSDAMAYSRFFDGNYTVESLEQISYQEYQQFEEALTGTGYIVAKDGSKWTVTSADEYCPASLSEQVIYWTKQLLELELRINTDTGFVENVVINENNSDIACSYCDIFREKVSENFPWTEGNYIEQLKDIIVKEVNFEDYIEIEMVSLLEGDATSDIKVVFRMQNKDEPGKQIYKMYDVQNLGVDYVGNFVPMQNTSSMVPWNGDGIYYSYAQVLSGYSGDVIYETVDGLIREYKVIDSFEGVTAEEIYIFIELLIEEIKSDYDHLKENVDDIVTVTPVYISLGNAEIEGGELEQNALWPIFRVEVKDYQYYGVDIEGECKYVAYDLYNMQIDTEQNKIIKYALDWDGPSSKKDFYQLLEKNQLLGTPEENPWVTELLPAELAKELEQKYGYELSELSIATE